MASYQEKQNFKSQLSSAIRLKCTEFTQKNGKISYNEAKSIVASVENVFRSRIRYVPKEIDAACNIALVILAPSMAAKVELIKKIASTFGGLAGLGAIIAGVGMALGWGTGTIAAVTAWFMGTAPWGPLGWIVGGVSVVVIAGYFYFSDDDAENAEKFEKALIKGLDEAIDKIWPKCGDELAEEKNPEASIK